MKGLRFLAILLIASTMLTGCDFFRSLVGKPTSKQLEQMKKEAEEQAARQRALEAKRKAEADSIAFAEAQRALAAQKPTINNSDSRFFVVLGSFKVKENAENYFELLKAKGYTPLYAEFQNDFDSVVVEGGNNVENAFKVMDQLLAFEFVPDDVWIYDVNRQWHK